MTMAGMKRREREPSLWERFWVWVDSWGKRL